MSLDCSGVYQITCPGNSRCYIGSSKNIQSRWSHHLHLLNGGYHYNRKLQTSFSKYGVESFSIEVLLVCSQEELLAREQEYLNRLSPELNCSMIATCLESTPEVRSRRESSTGSDPLVGLLGNQTTGWFRRKSSVQED